MTRPKNTHSEKTHFGYETINLSEKQQRVNQVFDSVATRYDVMNDLMSLGIHRLWKRYMVLSAQLRCTDTVLDLAAGTGDIAQYMVHKLNDARQLVLADINQSMLSIGRQRLLDQGHCRIQYVRADAKCLPFADASFDCVTMAFGLRNVDVKEKALSAIHSVLKPRGRFVLLEFSKPVLPLLTKMYDYYSFHVLPHLGQWVVGDSRSYQYLVESIRRHPPQQEMLSLLKGAGFSRCHYTNISGGIVTIHRGFKD